MTATAVRPHDAAMLAEIERVHPAYVCDGIPDGWELFGPPEPCERCGTRVFALLDKAGHVGWFHVGWLRPGASTRKCVPCGHLPELCSAARRYGIRLEGREAAELRWLMNPPADSGNGGQIDLFGAAS